MRLEPAPILLISPELIFIKCPYCGGIHRHGNQHGDMNWSHYGTTIPHCKKRPENAEYFLLATHGMDKTKEPSVIRYMEARMKCSAPL
jgi:hypothetical protein